MFLNVGLDNGIFFRSVVDPTQGDISDTRTRLLGTKPIRFVVLYFVFI
jgi:splicing factor 3B subunit 3